MFAPELMNKTKPPPQLHPRCSLACTFFDQVLQNPLETLSSGLLRDFCLYCFVCLPGLGCFEWSLLPYKPQTTDSYA